VLETRAIDLCDLVRRTAAVFTERGAEQQFVVSTAPVWINGDAVRIEQVISNIVGNAAKYTPVGGKIAISLSTEADEAVLRVQDDGFGIPPELLPRVFDLFVQGERTLDRSQGGLGIGLTLVRRLVTLHHGTVTVSSEGPNRGSLFTVRLPSIVAPGKALVDSELPRARAAQRRVLIVEDNRDAREMFRLMLELDGHQVIEAEEGCRGLQLLRSESPDIAFIDVGLPGLDGYEIARRFLCEGDDWTSAGSAGAGAGPQSHAGGITTAAHHLRRKRVLLVALTGYGTPDALEQSRRAGFDHHLIKPVNPEALYKLLSANALDDGSSVAASAAAKSSDAVGSSRRASAIAAVSAGSAADRDVSMR
jgi:CheY-like chemotaxis protein/anti-sigma regulatory factor (Ser/Thr protein kinase)